MRHRLLKSLRIAVTAISLLVCGLLIVLWVRSYSDAESFDGPFLNSTQFHFGGYRGDFELLISDSYPANDPYNMKIWVIFKDQYDNGFRDRHWIFYSNPKKHNILQIRAPNWFYLTIFAAIAALPWIKWRFSLRTLLIIMTLFAVFFGAIAMSM